MTYSMSCTSTRMYVNSVPIYNAGRTLTATAADNAGVFRR